MIVSIIDIRESHKIEPILRKRVFETIDAELKCIRSALHGESMAGPQRVRSDEIEIATNNWPIHARVIHFLLAQNLRIYVGLGAHRIDIWNPEDINACDGPAFWKASEALEKAKKKVKTKRMKTTVFIDYIVEPDTPIDQLQGIMLIIMYTAWIQKLKPKTRLYLYEYIWRNKTISRIAEEYNKTPQNIYKIINRTLAGPIKEIIEYYQNSLFDQGTAP